MVGWAELLHHPIKKKHKVQFSTNPIPKDEIKKKSILKGPKNL
jgi:hypothetical protein